MPSNFAYFQTLASNLSAPGWWLNCLIVFFVLCMMVEAVSKSEAEILYVTLRILFSKVIKKATILA